MTVPDRSDVQGTKRCGHPFRASPFVQGFGDLRASSGTFIRTVFEVGALSGGEMERVPVLWVRSLYREGQSGDRVWGGGVLGLFGLRVGRRRETIRADLSVKQKAGNRGGGVGW